MSVSRFKFPRKSNIQLEQVLSDKPVLETMERLLINYNWYIGYNDTKLDFIISDNPAQMVWRGVMIYVSIYQKIKQLY